MEITFFHARECSDGTNVFLGAAYDAKVSFEPVRRVEAHVLTASFRVWMGQLGTSLSV